MESADEFSALVAALGRADDVTTGEAQTSVAARQAAVVSADTAALAENAAVPSTRALAGLPLSGDLTLAQLVAAGLCPAPEGGSWTPTLYGEAAAGLPVFNTASGTYYKVGRLVYLYGLIQISNRGGMAGNVHIGGLPFAFVNLDVRLSFSYGFNVSSGTPCGGGGNGDNFMLRRASSLDIATLDSSEIQDAFQLQFIAVGAAAE